MQTRTPLPKQGEHFLAYFLTAACIGLAVEQPRARLYLAGVLMALAGALEISQALVPGRTPGMADFLGSCLGAWAGVGMAALMTGLLRRLPGGAGRP
ncbi:VanZ family protein [Camelimonas sp. ID_303_24]